MLSIRAEQAEETVPYMSCMQGCKYVRGNDQTCMLKSLCGAIKPISRQFGFSSV